jgi:hypothetical protein
MPPSPASIIASWSAAFAPMQTMRISKSIPYIDAKKGFIQIDRGQRLERRVYREDRPIGLPSNAEYRHQPIADEPVDIAILPLGQLADLRKVAVQKGTSHRLCRCNGPHEDTVRRAYLAAIQ